MTSKSNKDDTTGSIIELSHAENAFLKNADALAVLNHAYLSGNIELVSTKDDYLLIKCSPKISSSLIYQEGDGTPQILFPSQLMPLCWLQFYSYTISKDALLLETRAANNNHTPGCRIVLYVAHDITKRIKKFESLTIGEYRELNGEMFCESAQWVDLHHSSVRYYSSDCIRITSFGSSLTGGALQQLKAAYSTDPKLPSSDSESSLPVDDISNLCQMAAGLLGIPLKESIIILASQYLDEMSVLRMLENNDN